MTIKLILVAIYLVVTIDLLMTIPKKRGKWKKFKRALAAFFWPLPLAIKAIHNIRDKVID